MEFSLILIYLQFMKDDNLTLLCTMSKCWEKT